MYLIIIYEYERFLILVIVILKRNYENNDYNKTIIRNNYFNKRQLNNSQNRRLFNPKTNNKLLRLSEEEDLFTFSKFKIKVLFK